MYMRNMTYVYTCTLIHMSSAKTSGLSATLTICTYFRWCSWLSFSFVDKRLWAEIGLHCGMNKLTVNIDKLPIWKQLNEKSLNSYVSTCHMLNDCLRLHIQVGQPISVFLQAPEQNLTLFGSSCDCFCTRVWEVLSLAPAGNLRRQYSHCTSLATYCYSSYTCMCNHCDFCGENQCIINTLNTKQNARPRSTLAIWYVSCQYSK